VPVVWPSTSPQPHPLLPPPSPALAPSPAHAPVLSLSLSLSLDPRAKEEEAAVPDLCAAHAPPPALAFGKWGARHPCFCLPPQRATSAATPPLADKHSQKSGLHVCDAQHIDRWLTFQNFHLPRRTWTTQRARSRITNCCSWPGRGAARTELRAVGRLGGVRAACPLRSVLGVLARARGRARAKLRAVLAACVMCDAFV